MSNRNPLRFIKNRFLRDAATLQVSGVLNQASQVVSSVVVAHLLSASGQGLFFSAIMLQALFYNLLSVGMVPAAVSQVAAAATRGLEQKVADWLAFLVKSYLVVSAILIGAGYFLLPALSTWWFSEIGELEPAAAHQLGIWAWWLTFWILLDTPRAMTQVAFHGTRRMFALGQLDNTQELMRMFLVVSGALITGSPAGAVLGEIASRAFASGLAIVLYLRARTDGEEAPLPGLLEIARRVPGIPLVRGARLGLRIGAIKTTTVIVTTVAPKLLLGGLAGMAWVSYFTVAQRFMGLATMLMQGVSRTSMPALAEQRARHDLAGFKRLYLRTTFMTGGAISGLVLFGLPFVAPVVGLLYPPDFAEPVALCCMILAVGVILSSFAVAQDPFYILCDRMRPNLIICITGMLVTIPGNVLLIYLWPTTGPVWGQSLYLSWVLVHFVYIAHYFRTARQSDEFWAH